MTHPLGLVGTSGPGQNPPVLFWLLMAPGLALLGFARLLQIARERGVQPKQNPELIGLISLALASTGLFLEYRQCNEEAAKREQQEEADRAREEGKRQAAIAESERQRIGPTHPSRC